MSASTYACGTCGAHGVKLWREYQSFSTPTKLFCAPCALKDQTLEGPVDKEGRRPHGGAFTDQIGWLVPAVPCVMYGGFYGYSSVPDSGVEWWRGLPTYRGNE